MENNAYEMLGPPGGAACPPAPIVEQTQLRDENATAIDFGDTCTTGVEVVEPPPPPDLDVVIRGDKQKNDKGGRRKKKPRILTLMRRPDDDMATAFGPNDITQTATSPASATPNTSNTVEQRSEQKEKRKKEKTVKSEDTKSRAWSIMSWFWGPAVPVDEMATAMEPSTEATNKSVRSRRSTAGGSESKSASKSTSKSTSRSQQRKNDKGNSRKKEEERKKKKSRITAKPVAISTQFVNKLKRAKIRKASEDKPKKPEWTRSLTKV